MAPYRSRYALQQLQVSQVKVYVDGDQYATEQSHGSDEHVFFHTTGRLNVGGYGYAMRTYDGSIQMFEGEIDDVMVWSKPLQLKVKGILTSILAGTSRQ